MSLATVPLVLLALVCRQAVCQHCQRNGVDGSEEAASVDCHMTMSLPCIFPGTVECLRLEEYHRHGAEYKLYEHAVFLKPNYVCISLK